MLEAFEKEQILQQHILETRLADCPTTDSPQLVLIAEDAVELAKKLWFNQCFGCLDGIDKCAIFVNLANAWVLDRFRQRLGEAGVHELAAAHWPKDGPDRAYTFPIIVESTDPEACREWAERSWKEGCRTE